LARKKLPFFNTTKEEFWGGSAKRLVDFIKGLGQKLKITPHIRL